MVEVSWLFLALLAGKAALADPVATARLCQWARLLENDKGIKIGII